MKRHKSRTADGIFAYSVKRKGWSKALTRWGFEFAGRRKVGFETRKEAELCREQLENDQLRGRRREEKNFEDALPEYVKAKVEKGKKLKSYLFLADRGWLEDGEKSEDSTGEKWLNYFTGHKVSSIIREDVEDVLARWSDFKPASLNNALSQLSGFFTWACRKRYASENPCRYIEKWETNNQRTRWLRRHEIEKLLSSARELDQGWLCDHIQFAAATGLRLSKVCDLRRADYSKDEKGNEYVEIEKDKNGDPFNKSLNGKIAEMVRRRVLRAPGPSSLIFGGPRGGTARSSIYRWLPEIAEKAGLVYGRDQKDGLTFHAFRHTMASQALNDGMSGDEIKSMGNWKTDSIVERYKHLSDERKRNAEARVAALICGAGEGA